MDRLKVFNTELSYIEDIEVRTFTEKALKRIPEYFFHVAASSTGKYHPSYALGSGGLARHTKALVEFAHTLLELEHNRIKFNEQERSIIVAAGILHDSYKHGIVESKYTVAEHPRIAAEQILTFADNDEEKIIAQLISSAILPHMGQWNTDYKTKSEILPKPKTDIEKFIHECDYLASRKFITVEFGEYYNPDNYNVKGRIAEIITYCKEQIALGVDRNVFYEIISKHNNGNKNPNTIDNMTVAEMILDEIRSVSNGSNS